MLSDLQIDAFNRSTQVSLSNFTTIVVSIAFVVMLLWIVWLTQAQFRLWATRKVEFYDMHSALLQAAVVVLLLGFLIR